MKLLPRIFPRNEAEHRAQLERALIRQEAKIGGQLFGPVPKGHHREFFCLDEHTWVWHEEWANKRGQRQTLTTRYEVRPNGVLKLQNGHVYQRLTRDEAWHLYQAVDFYQQKVKAHYRQVAQAQVA